MKKLLSILLVLIMMLCTVSYNGFLSITSSAKIKEEYSAGDIITFGTYPQSKVTNSEIISELNDLSLNWLSYDYMETRNQPGNYMQYADTIYGGVKYRAVKFTKYRASYATNAASTNCENYQSENGYYINNVYWFKYEPIRWRILDPKSGLVVSELLIDAQPFNDYDYDGFIDSDHTNYINMWENSTARAWLNGKFYDLAFSAEEKELINNSQIQNRGYYSTYNYDDTLDKVFLLSYSDVNNADYGFSSNASRKVQGTDYCKCQGLGCTSDGFSCWRLRTAGTSSYTTCHVHTDGSLYCGSVPTATNVVVRPVCYYDGLFCQHENISKAEAVAATCYSVGHTEGYICNDCGKVVTGCETVEKTNHFDNNNDNFCDCCDAYLLLSNGDIIDFGSYPQSRIDDQNLINNLNALDLEWISYNYYSGNGSSGSMKSSDYMKYADVMYNGEKYRAVKFTSYRQFNTYHTSSIDTSYQDNNGYYINNVYWFKYEPIKWRILDIEKGLLISEKIIDSQAMNPVCYGGYGTYIDSSLSIPINKWENSFMRSWLNSDFSGVAFDSNEQKIMIPTENTNNGFEGIYNFDNTIDLVFLLSSEEVINTQYGFSSVYSDYDVSRIAHGTDYAKSQGLKVSAQDTSWWRLRSAGSSADNVQRLCHVGEKGEINNITGPSDPIFGEAYCCDSGVRPAITINLNSYLCSKGIHEYGNWMVTENATTIKDGTETKFCSHCKSTETRSIPKLEPIVVKIQDSINTNYRANENITSLVYNPSNIDYVVSYSSSNSNTVTVDNNGRIYAAKTGSATVVCTVTDEFGKSVTDSCIVNVEYAWWQWIIEIVLFGWLWY